MKQWQATTLAFLIAPCVPALSLSGAGSLGFALALYPFSALAVLALGIPAYLLGRWLKLVRWWSALIVGLIGGAIVWFSQSWQLVLHPVPGVTHADLVQGCLLVCFIGSLTGLAFWAVRTWGHTEAPVP